MVESVVCLLANAYRLIDQIGSGGTSTVWRALAPDNSNVAVKVIPMDRLDREGKVRSRFNAEVSASRRLRSDHIVRMLDYGEEETLPSLGHKHGAFYIVFEYVSGITLLNKLEDDGCLDSDAFLELAIAVGSALSVAHDSTPRLCTVTSSLRTSFLLTGRPRSQNFSTSESHGPQSIRGSPPWATWLAHTTISLPSNLTHQRPLHRALTSTPSRSHYGNA